MTDDDPSIQPSTRLYRRVHPEQVIWDHNLDRLRPTSAAFSPREMSVNLSDDLAANQLEPEFALRHTPHHHLVWIIAQLAREQGQAVVRSHYEDHPEFGTDPSHGDVVGAKTGLVRDTFATEAEWEVLRTESLSAKNAAHLDS